jgi:hypothetical protein
VFTDKDYYHDLWLRPDVKLLQKNVNDLVPAGLAEKSIDVGPHVDLSYLEAAIARVKK